MCRADVDLLTRRRGPRAARPARHRRHRADAPGRGGRHAGRRGLRPVRSARATRLRGRHDRVVRIDLPCSPCNRIRLPAGALRRPHAGLPRAVSADSVFAAAVAVLDAVARRRGEPAQRVRMTDDELDRRQRRRDRGASISRVVPRRRRRRAARTKPRTPGSRRCGTLRVDGAAAARAASRYRGDSLWWFAELYLHKQQVDPRRASASLAALDSARSSASGRWPSTSSSGPHAGRPRAAGRARAGRSATSGPARPGRRRLARLAAHGRCARARADAGGARVAAARPARAGAPARAQVAAFVHRAFWRPDGDGRQRRVVHRAGAARARARAAAGGACATSASARARTSARAAGGTRSRRRAATRRRARSSASRRGRRCASRGRVWRRAARAAPRAVGQRDAARARGHPRLRLLAARPRAARRHRAAAVAVVGARDGRSRRRARRARARASRVTYAEAGGWGRALVLECRRRGIPSVGLQHGFIYRHWLNYLHEPDEMAPIRGTPRTPGSRARR